MGSNETTKRFDPNRYQAIAVSEIRAEIERRRVAFWRRVLVGFLIVATIGSLALFACFARCGGVR